MQSQYLTYSSNSIVQRNENEPGILSHSQLFFKKPSLLLKESHNFLSLCNNTKSTNRNHRAITFCSSSAKEEIITGALESNNSGYDCASSSSSVSVSEREKEMEEVNEMEGEVVGLENQSIWEQVKEIVMFTGPATGLWLCGPLMSLIDTSVVGQGSSIELAALGPGTVMCDSMSYIFMFLSVATTNMVATSLAKQDKNEVQRHLSILLFIGLTCGLLMLLFTKFLGASVLTAFIGSKNIDVVPVANTYVQIRGLAWPAILVGWVAQSASLGMKDSWGPLKALAVSSVVSGIGDILLCRVLDYGIAGAAWTTMASQIIAAYMMINSLNEMGYNAYRISVPSPSDFKRIFGLAAPAFIMMMSKVAFFASVMYSSTSMGTLTLAAHQVLIQVFFMFAHLGEPLCQAAQSFMPELLYGINRSSTKALMLLKSLVIIALILGLVLGGTATSLVGLFPTIFTLDQMVIQKMQSVLLPLFIATIVSPCTLSLEGTLLAGQDLKYVSLSMSGCFTVASIILALVRSQGYGLLGCWCTIVGFQWARFFLSLKRLLSPGGILFSEDSSNYELKKLKAA